MTSTCSLSEKRCKPCEGGVPALTPDAVAELMKGLHADWGLAADGRSITRSFRFRDYHQTIGFVNALAWIANTEDHHPDLEVFYDRCVVKWWTHAVSGLTENDFICAAKLDRLLA
ncbi:MAG: 4a-hydroxytetrahydrobiopterin dehydratase [Gammaproteobacteria bacterium]|jgi:4a-hydroxytetrahydrobiopterin dehydratase|nr:4a-hydroxytetrahydrobiopterin dehydratase [Gammaproteobacteria bacterium]